MSKKPTVLLCTYINIIEKLSFFSGITIEKVQVYSNVLKSSDVSWYLDTFGTMHRYSCTLYHPISNLSFQAFAHEGIGFNICFIPNFASFIC